MHSTLGQLPRFVLRILLLGLTRRAGLRVRSKGKLGVFDTRGVLVFMSGMSLAHYSAPKWRG